MIQFEFLEKNHHNNIDRVRPGFLPDYSVQCPFPYIERHSCTHGTVIAVYGAHMVHGAVIRSIVPYIRENFFQFGHYPIPQSARNRPHLGFPPARGFCTLSKILHIILQTLPIFAYFCTPVYPETFINSSPYMLFEDVRNIPPVPRRLFKVRTYKKPVPVRYRHHDRPRPKNVRHRNY